jgi:hypothetical protein
MKYKFVGDGPKWVSGFERRLEPGDIVSDEKEVALVERMPQNAVRAMFAPVREAKKIATPTVE